MQIRQFLMVNEVDTASEQPQGLLWRLGMGNLELDLFRYFRCEIS